MIAGMPRAPRLCVEDRRRELAQATLPLVIEHGRAVTTRQIAQAAGVAEGTIFRVFDTKDDLVVMASEVGVLEFPHDGPIRPHLSLAHGLGVVGQAHDERIPRPC